MESIALAVASFFGVGFIPKASGTAGTAATVPVFVYLVGPLPLGGRLAVMLAVTALGVWASGVAGRVWGDEDSPRIVIDEAAGYLLTMLLSPVAPGPILVGFGLFRLFDITKPPPCRKIDREVGGGWGAMLDDLAAGLYALLALYAVHFVLARAGISLYGLGAA